MKSPTFRDAVLLSSRLDDQLSGREAARLEARLKTNRDLALLLSDLRFARQLLRQTPRHRVPRSFTLQASMKRVQPPLPRLVPALSWASAASLLLFVFVLATSLLGPLSLGAGAPMAAAPLAMEAYGVGGGPVAEDQPAVKEADMTPTPEEQAMLAVESPSADRTLPVPPSESPAPEPVQQPLNPWLFILPGLGVLLLLVSLSIRLVLVRAFRRRGKSAK